MIDCEPRNSNSVVFPTSKAFKLKKLTVIRSKDDKLKFKGISFQRLYLNQLETFVISC